MADLNKVFLIGRLTRDPELRYTPNGAPVTDLRLATSRQYTGRDGAPQEDKLFVDVTPQELASKGKTFPIKQYFDDILESYEKKVLN